MTLFDGSGAEFSARVERVGRAEVELAVLDRVEVDRELPLELTLAAALPKGDRQRWLVEKATELGVARLVPLVTSRSGEGQSRASLDKLRRAVVEASKQCGRNRLMEIATPQPLAVLLDAAPPAALQLLAHPGGRPVREMLTDLSSAAPPAALQLAVGPEGGFTDEEVALAQERQWQVVGLGRRILRIETAALALVSLVANSVEPGGAS